MNAIAIIAANNTPAVAAPVWTIGDKSSPEVDTTCGTRTGIGGCEKTLSVATGFGLRAA
jgi:hypothetical protein